MLPSLLLMIVFSIYSFLQCYDSKIFLNNFKFIKISVIILFICLAIKIFSTTYIGYKNASYCQEFNLGAIKKFYINSVVYIKEGSNQFVRKGKRAS